LKLANNELYKNTVERMEEKSNKTVPSYKRKNAKSFDNNNLRHKIDKSDRAPANYDLPQVSNE
jgi:hypothetical protein